MKCSLSLCSPPEHLGQKVALLGNLACCSLAKQPAVAVAAIEDGEEVVSMGEVAMAIGEDEVVAAVSAALVATGNLHP
jgi:hypothetical protein